MWAHVVIDPIRDEQGDLIGFAKVTRDITERKDGAGGAAAERGALPAAGPGRDRLRHLHARSRRPRHQLELRARSGSRATRNTRSSASTSRPSTPPRTARPGCRQQALETAAREGRFEKEGWRVRKDGSRFFANVIIDPIRDESGDLIGFAKVTRDITERKAAEEALEKARAEATRRRRWRPSRNSPRASRTTSTIC